MSASLGDGGSACVCAMGLRDASKGWAQFSLRMWDDFMTAKTGLTDVLREAA